MSRIGKLPITIPQGVNINVSKTNEVTVKGPLGELKQQVDPCITLEIEDNTLNLKRQTEEKNHKAMHGLYRSLLANMVTGVSEGFTIVQELVGTGYRAQAIGQTLTLTLGYSHNIIIELANEIKVETIAERGKNPIIKLSSHDKQLLAQVAAKIRSYRKPEPYKGKGILYQGEVVRRKTGKSAE
ncbi:MAG: 50S ribosomal protein L6 [Bacteroidales bacterium]|nr:50S ribosomal protein L6 [Bacteroidales bacterium]